MFVPVRITSGDGSVAYDRMIETSARFDVLGKRVRDMTEPLTAIGGDLHTQIEAAFATEGATGATGKWAVLSPAYSAWKAEHGGGPLLVGLKPLSRRTRHSPRKPPQTYKRSGAMRLSLLDPLATHITPERLLYAPSSPYAGYHETGTSRMPARPPVDPSLNFLHAIDRTFVTWMAKLMSEEKL